MLKNMNVTSRMILSFGLPILLIGCIVVIGFSVSGKVLSNALLVKNESVVYSGVARDMKLAVVQTQQWLTDISATRGQDGLNDGFDQAEMNAVSFKEGADKFIEMYEAENNAAQIEKISALQEAYDSFYLEGKEMAKAYIEGGPAAGNKMMAAFDEAVNDISKKIDAFVDEQQKESDDSLANTIASIKILRTSILAVSALAAFLIILLGVLFTRSITASFEKVLAAADEKVEYLQNLPTPIIAVDKDYTVKYANLAAASVLGRSQGDTLGVKCYDLFKTHHCNTGECRVRQAIERDGVFTGETSTTQNGRKIDIEYTGAPIKDKSGNIIGAMEFVIDITERKNVLKDIVGVAEGLADGDLSRRLNGSYQGDYEMIANYLNTSMQNLQGVMKEITAVCSDLAKGDLTTAASGDFKGDYLAIVNNLNEAIGGLHEVVSQVAEAVDQVNTASGQISASAQGVAEGTSEQASSLEEISSSLEEMSSMTKQNADNAAQAQALSNESKTSTDKGGEAVSRMNRAIEDIKKSSDATAKIIKTIDEIAFQTNLLALNAAVEAARAGEAGKGFAVVAEEVRNLAMRSAEAAKNTANMIEASVGNSEKGVKIAEEVSQTLKEIALGSEKVNNLVAEIAAASKEQALGIEQVNIAMGQMDKVTQQNASSAEESASAAEELSSQSKTLASMVSNFRIKGSGGSRRIEQAPARQASQSVSGNGKKVFASAGVSSRSERGSANEIIPLDDEDFREFKNKLMS